MQNSFKIKYSTLVWVLLAIVAVLSLLGVMWNVYNLISYLHFGTTKVLTYALLIIATGALCAIVFSVIFLGKYTVNKGVLCMHLGFFTIKNPIDQIVCLTLFKKSNKLVAYFSDNKYTVILIDPQCYEDFILSLRDKNPKIVYDTRFDGEDTPY